MEISKRDLAILTNLRHDSRMTLTNLSKKTGVPISTIFERLKQFRNSGLIKFIALADFGRLGFITRVLVAVKVDKSIRSKLEEYLSKHLYVNSLLRINNGFNYMIEGIFKDMAGAEEFVEDLEDKFRIKKAVVYHVLGDMMRESFLSDNTKAEVILNGDV